MRNWSQIIDKILIVAALLLGGVLVWMAGPRTLAAFHSLPAALIVFQHEMGKPIQSVQISAAQHSIEHAKALETDVSHSDTFISQLSLMQAEMEDDPELQEAAIQTAFDATSAALSRRPLDPYLWTQYAQLSYLTQGLTPYTISALNKSFHYGAYEYRLIPVRLALAFREWERMPPMLRDRAREQTALISSSPTLCGDILARLDETAAYTFVGFLEEADADIERIQQRATALRQLQRP